MATLQLVPVATLNGATYATAQFIIAPMTPDRRKLILPKLEAPASGSSACTSPLEAASAARALKTRCALLGGCRPKRKLSFSSAAAAAAAEREEGGARARPAGSISKRNARERNRVKQVNLGFVTLASHVPSNMRPKKMSKVETLKSAIKYIRYLRQVVDQQLGCGLSEPSSLLQQQQQQPPPPSRPSLPQQQQLAAMQQQRQFAASAPGPAQQISTLRLEALAAAAPCPYSVGNFAGEAFAASLPQTATAATTTGCFLSYDSAAAGFATPPYDVPSPTSSMSSSFTSGGGGGGGGACSYDDSYSYDSSDCATSSPYETSLSQDEQDLLDFASWFE